MSDEKIISNFISLSKKCYLLSKNDMKISHDIPFVNEYSGEIEIKIVAQTPIYIRNRYIPGEESYKDKSGNNISKLFCHYKGKQYIPGSSIKGMVSNIIDILSYGKLGTKIDPNYIDRVNNIEYKDHISDSLDLTEAIFGTTELKGRASFSHFQAIKTTEANKVETVLMSPAAKENKIGWKNYPIEDSVKPSLKKIGSNEKIITYFNPLGKGTSFKGKLRFHNLRGFELGAILSALSFHNTKESFHNIGMGKSQGYGKILISFQYQELNKLLQSFEEKMNIELFECEEEWHESFYIKKLLEKHSFQNVAQCFSSEDNLYDYYMANKDTIMEKKNKLKQVRDKQIKDKLEVFRKKVSNPRVKITYTLENLSKSVFLAEDEILKIFTKLNIEVSNDNIDYDSILKLVDILMNES